MKIVFHTNIDAYNRDYFPNYEFINPQVPRVGDLVRVRKEFFAHFMNEKLPLRLEVVRVEWAEEYIFVELWYNKTDKQLADAAGAKTL